MWDDRAQSAGTKERSFKGGCGEQLSEALEDFHGERSVRAVILTGSGDSFCAGTDLSQLKETAESKNALALWHKDSRAFLELIEQMLRFPKPIIASVNGWVLGSGVSLMLASEYCCWRCQFAFGNAGGSAWS